MPPGDRGTLLGSGRFAPPTAAEVERAGAHLLEAEREAPRTKRIPAGVTGRPIGTAGIVGFGTMGRGIALAFTAAGIPVTVVEESDESWARGEAAVAGSLARAVARGRCDEAEAARRAGRIRRASNPGDLGAADFVVEAVFEDLALKERVFAELDRVAKPEAVLATNTSSLDVDRIAAATRRPGRVVGAHFFSPAHAMRLVEVVAGAKTEPAVLQTTIRLALRLGKAPAPVGVCDGFVGNRMLYAFRRQADRLLLEGALPEEVDRALTGFGFRMGPFAVADLAGLDIGAAVRRRHAEEARARGEPAPPRTVADRLVERGALGQKTGRGFFRYEPGDRTPHPDPEVARLVAEASADAGIARRSVEPEEIRKRCLFALVNEGAEILAEGIAERAGDVDVIWTLGYGFPASRGGPLWWAEHAVGYGTIRQELLALADRTGDPSLAPGPGLNHLGKESARHSSGRVSRSSRSAVVAGHPVFLPRPPRRPDS